MNNPLVTVGLPVYNGEKYLEASIQSILDQTFRDFELLILDNASTDRTQEICERYAAQDSRIRYHRNAKNVGAAKNQNDCVWEAKGKYFRWQHADDLAAPTLVEECLKPLEADESIVMCYASGKLYLDEEGNKHRHPKLRDFNLMSEAPHERFEKFLQQFYPETGSTEQLFGLMRTETLRQCTLLRTYSSSDIMFCGELAIRGKWKRVDKPLFFYRYHPDQSTQLDTKEEQMEWWDPTLEGEMNFTVWRWLLDYISRIQGAPLSRAEKLRCLRVLHRSFVRHMYNGLAVEPLGWMKKVVFSGGRGLIGWFRAHGIEGAGTR